MHALICMYMYHAFIRFAFSMGSAFLLSMPIVVVAEYVALRVLRELIVVAEYVALRVRACCKYSGPAQTRGTRSYWPVTVRWTVSLLSPPPLLASQLDGTWCAATMLVVLSISAAALPLPDAKVASACCHFGSDCRRPLAYACRLFALLSALCSDEAVTP